MESLIDLQLLKKFNQMVETLKLAIEDGSIGLSTGLAYPAANAAPTSEIIELVKILPKFDGIFTTHMRNEAIDVIKSVKETIEICSSTKVRTLSHTINVPEGIIGVKVKKP